MEMETIGNFKCLKCNYEYSHPPRPTECPICGHLYVKWLNYEEMFGGRVLEEEYYAEKRRTTNDEKLREK